MSDRDYNYVDLDKLRQLIEDAVELKTAAERMRLLGRAIPECPSFVDSKSIYYFGKLGSDGSMPDGVMSIQTLSDNISTDPRYMWEYLDIAADPESYHCCVMMLMALNEYLRKKLERPETPLKEESRTEMHQQITHKILREMWRLISIYQHTDPVCTHSIANSVVEELLYDMQVKLRDIARDPAYLTKRLEAKEKAAACEKQRRAAISRAVRRAAHKAFDTLIKEMEDK